MHSTDGERETRVAWRSAGEPIAAGAHSVRGNALWGTGGRSRTAVVAIVLTLVFALQLAFASTASASRMPKSLRDAMKATPSGTFKVIVTGTKSTNSSAVENKVKNAMSAYRNTGAVIKKRFNIVNAEAATLTGQQLNQLYGDPGIESIVPDTVVRSAYANTQTWPNVHEVQNYSWNFATYGGQAATIAIVDSGVDSTRADIAGRVLTQVNFTTLTPNSAGDGRGHGTFVASIAAGSANGYAGVSPNAKLVSLDVLADNGEGVVSDVIAAADWIYANKSSYNIRVANFSLTGSTDSSFMYDPLDKAVEKLWFSGVVVVAAAGNYAVDGATATVRYAPANDPFVITVGAADTDGSTNTRDDFNAPWSTYGYTHDGFAKPDLGASGRYMNGAVPTASTMYKEHPERVVAPGYMWMSGTSFAAPVVSGAAAYLLGKYPSWTPDQVKGALMLEARPVDHAAPASLGVGEVKMGQSSTITDPPNPNLALNGFLTPDVNGGPTPVFDSASWASTASSNASWASASWASASWSSASWSSASWASASWASASWASASWATGTMADGAAIPSASWSTGTWVQ